MKRKKIIDGKRQCSVCKQFLPVSSFGKIKQNKVDGLQYHCKKCGRNIHKEYRENNRGKYRNSALKWYYKNRDHVLEKQKKDREKNKQRTREYGLKYKYGITQADYDIMYKNQEGKCAICGSKKKNLHVDHDHKTNGVRGLLCHHCNHGLGNFMDNIKSMKNAIFYLDNGGRIE